VPQNPRTGLKTGHYKPKRKAPASEGGRYGNKRNPREKSQGSRQKAAGALRYMS
jgi:hypothetical protein